MVPAGDAEILGTSSFVADLRAQIARVARSDAKILITGESGTGKELVARAIHAASDRAAALLAPVNCAGLPETLLESELFGHVKGSFTGAYRDKPGKFELANHGTLFLDEIGEMTLRMQALLLRFLETGEIQKVGAEHTVRVPDVRVIAATNRNLRDLMAQGEFRADLFYRLDVVHIVVPPLRDRREDIPLLVNHALHKFTSRNGTEGPFVVRGISPRAMTALVRHSWPGNIRELDNVIERLVVTGSREIIDVDDLDPEIRLPAVPSGRPAHERRRTVADELLKRLFVDHESFWTAVYPFYLDHELTRSNVRDLIEKGLREARGNYTILARLFNIEPSGYKRFMNFLHKHRCHVPFKEYR